MRLSTTLALLALCAGLTFTACDTGEPGIAGPKAHFVENANRALSTPKTALVTTLSQKTAPAPVDLVPDQYKWDGDKVAPVADSHEKWLVVRFEEWPGTKLAFNKYGDAVLHQFPSGEVSTGRSFVTSDETHGKVLETTRLSASATLPRKATEAEVRELLEQLDSLVAAVERGEVFQ